MNDLLYPATEALWHGILLRSIVNATMIAECPDYALGYSWDGLDLVIQRGDGKTGAITFRQKAVIGAFFDPRSNFSPYRVDRQYSLNLLLQGIPSEYTPIAEHVLRYNMQRVDGSLKPVATAVFWNHGPHLCAALPWCEVLANGAHLVKTEVTDNTEKALLDFEEAYQMKPDQVRFAKRIYDMKRLASDRLVNINGSDVQFLKNMSISAGAFRDCCRAFSAMGIGIDESIS